MRNLKNYLIIFLIFGFLIGWFIYQKKTTREIDSKSLDLTNSSIEDILGTYWNASLNSNLDVVKQVVTFPPENMFQDCIGKKKSETSENTKYIPSKIEELDYTIGNASNEAEVKNPFASEDIPNDISLLSQYIISSKISFNRIKITKKAIYQDESILELIIMDEKGNFQKTGVNEKILFFKRENEIWKLVGVANKDIMSSISDRIDYAIPRPLCEQIK